MTCFRLVKAYRSPEGGVVFNSKQGYADRPLELPCGQCRGCRLERTRQWALRLVHEASLHQANSFITLTYSDEHLPRDGSLDVDHFQRFMKRLRKARPGRRLRYYHCGEYGDENLRPHYHACLFNEDFAGDRQLWKTTDHGPLWTSPELESIWGMGYAVVGDLTWSSAAYVSRYVMKKRTRPGSSNPEVRRRQEEEFERYARADLETGELYYVKPEYSTMSRRPGLGKGWYEKYKDEVFPDDFVVHDGKKQSVPQFYMRQLEEERPDLASSVKSRRKDAAYKYRGNNTEERLRVREEVLEAKTASLKRDL